MHTRTTLRQIHRGVLMYRIDRGRPSVCNKTTHSRKGYTPDAMVLVGNYTQCTKVPCSRMATSTPQINSMQKMQDFLQTFYAYQEHGILSTESSCKKFCQLYRQLDDADKKTFLCYLAENYGANQDLIVQVSQQVVTSQERGEAVLLRTEERLRSALVPRFQLLFSQIGRIEGGVKHLVDMRADILNFQSTVTSEMDTVYLRILQISLRELLSLWFTVGFLKLERITWESPCDMVQKISEYEAVHPIRNWADLKRRVGPYRRCFVFNHSSMPREPVVVLHTALTKEISSSIHSIIGNPAYASPFGSPLPSTPSVVVRDDKVEDPMTINTAMFYSITSTQKGLQGVDLGNYLIKKVVSELQQELPSVSQFSSISPIPGFREWLIGEINGQLHTKSEELNGKPAILTEEEMTELCNFTTLYNQDALETFKELISNHTWSNNEDYSKVVKTPLMRLCARYLYIEKRRGYALNPVANFHLQNGAVLWRLNWLGDMTLRGLNKSCGIMVNYRYYLEHTEQNSREYIENHKINADGQIQDLL